MVHALALRSSLSSTAARDESPVKQIATRWTVGLVVLGVVFKTLVFAAPSRRWMSGNYQLTELSFFQAIATINFTLSILDIFVLLTRRTASPEEDASFTDRDADLMLADPFIFQSKSKRGANIFLNFTMLLASFLDLVSAVWGIWLIAKLPASWPINMQRYVYWKITYAVWSFLVLILWSIVDPLRGILTLPLTAGVFVVLWVVRDHYRALKVKFDSSSLGAL